MLQNTALSRRFRSRSSSPKTGEHVHADRQDEERHDSEADEAHAHDLGRAAGVRRQTDGEHEADRWPRTANGTASHPASSAVDMSRSAGVLCEMPTATCSASSGIASASAGLTSTTLSLTSWVASSTVTSSRLRRPWKTAECSSRTPAWKMPWNASVATTWATTCSSTGRAATTTCEVWGLLLEGVQDLIGDCLTGRRAP